LTTLHVVLEPADEEQKVIGCIAISESPLIASSRLCRKKEGYCKNDCFKFLGDDMVNSLGAGFARDRLPCPENYPDLS